MKVKTAPKVLLSQATKAQLADLFTNGRMNVYARDDKSGTYDTFKSLVLRGRSLPGNAKRFEDSQALVAGVTSDPNGIGICLNGCQGIQVQTQT
jgi:ABC-type phosphate transport system substrate-binding protein